jgi:2,4-dienoyl-CoA reductase-like NADH-dependent reductase (Old Yellow Enzyme family)
VSASAIAPAGHVSLLRPERPYEVPRALDTDEMPQIVAAFRRGAENALTAGFDGVEIHGANGYLLDQFLQDSTNKRTDAYGGGIENRARLHLEVTDAVVSVWGAARTAMHLAPRGDAMSMGDSDPISTFGYLARELGKRKLAFICTRERAAGDSIGRSLKSEFGGALIANEGFTPSTAALAVANGEADAVAFGKLFLANPDLPARIANGDQFNTPDPATFYASGPKGYTDYPALTPEAVSR